MLFNAKISNLSIVIPKLNSRFLEFNKAINSNISILTNQQTNFDYSPTRPSIRKKNHSGAIKINFDTVVTTSKLTTVVVIQDSKGKILDSWSKFYLDHFAEEGESCVLLLSLQLVIQNNYKTVYLKEDNKNAIKDLMHGDYVVLGRLNTLLFKLNHSCAI